MASGAHGANRVPAVPSAAGDASSGVIDTLSATRDTTATVVFDFLKKKLQDAAPKPSARVVPGSEADYEERRKWAENLRGQGRTADAITLLEELAGDLAGAGNFPLAVAVRHQIHQWRGGPASETPQDEGKRMAERRTLTQSTMSARKLPDSLPPPAAAPLPATSTRPAGVTESAVMRVTKASAFLGNLNGDEIAELIRSTGLTGYRAGTVVVEEGSPGDSLYIVTRGALTVTTKSPDGHAVRVGTLVVGDFFGEVSLLTGKPRAATVTAETDAECLQVGVEKWTEMTDRAPQLKTLLEQAIAVRAILSAEAVVDDLRKRRGS